MQNKQEERDQERDLDDVDQFVYSILISQKYQFNKNIDFSNIHL